MARRLPVEFAKKDLLAAEVGRLRNALQSLEAACQKSQAETCFCANCQTFRSMRNGIQRVLKEAA